MNERPLVGVVDQGTTGTRFVVVDRLGHILESAYAPHDRHHPRSSWFEHDTREIWRNTEHVVRQVFTRGEFEPSQLVAVGVTNQRETVVCWDVDTGEQLHNALGWQDRRTTDRIDELSESAIADDIRSRTGLELDAYFSAPKLEWLLDNIGDVDARERARSGEVLCGTMDSWLLYNLTGEHVTDVTNASRTMLFDVHDLAWDDELLAEFDIPRAALPAVCPSIESDAYGTTDSDGCFGFEIPVSGVLGDQQAALFGQTCFDVGEVKNTNGTGSFCLMNTGTEAVRSDNGLLTTVAFQRSGEPAKYALEGSVFSTGTAIEWLQDIGIVDNASATERLARAVDSSGDVYMVPSLSGLGAPHWNRTARGLLIGLTRDTRREHIVRATLEGIAFQVRDVTEAMEADSGRDVTTLRVDGAMMRNDFMCQLQADIDRCEVIRPVVDETTALGAAYAAGLAVGYWDSLDELRETWKVGDRFLPERDDSAVEDAYEKWGRAVEQARAWELD